MTLHIIEFLLCQTGATTRRRLRERGHFDPLQDGRDSQNFPSAVRDLVCHVPGLLRAGAQPGQLGWRHLRQHGGIR